MIKILLVILFLALAIVFSKLPYFNLVLKPKVIVFLGLVLIVLLFPIKPEQLVKICLFLLLLALILTLLGAGSAAELTGELIYGFLFLAIVKKMVGFLR